MTQAHVLVWVQHLLGTGHLRRATTLAGAMAARGLAVTVASGGPPVAWPLPAGVDLVQLPPVHTDVDFAALLDARGRPVDDAFRARRRDALLALFRRLEPGVLITEMFPFGRRMFRFELCPLLEAAAAARPRPWVVSSVRDILVARSDPARYAWMRDVALAHFDRVLVHADPALIPFGLSFPHAAELGGRLIHTGYVTEDEPPPPTADGVGEVIVSAGGGRVGARLLEVARAARPLARHAAPWRLIGGAGRGTAGDGAGLILDRQRTDFRALLANALLSVSQAGYNTVVEALKLGRPMLLVPFETASETEQGLRAERLARVGLAGVVRENALSPIGLARAVDARLDAPPPPVTGFALDGAARSADLVAQLVASGEPPR